MADAGVLEAPHVLEFAYTRSTGPIVGAFLAGLRDGRVLGVRAEDGRVLVPPQEHDPDTAADLSQLVEVGTAGTVTTWSWNPQPKRDQPLDRPFAWALIRLDGADTPLLHAVDADPEQMSTGMRVAIRWAEERTGSIRDIACFEPSEAPAAAAATDVEAPADPVRVVTIPSHIDMVFRPSIEHEPFLLATQRRELLGRRCSQCQKVYLPPRGVCAMCGAAFTDEQVPCGPRGTVATFLTVNVPFAGQEVEIPYTAAEVLFDGAHTTSQFLLRGIPVSDVRMGMRVEAVWKDGADLAPTLSNITHVVPVDEPDLPYEAFAEYA